jgi:hypothetical protein
MAAEQDGLQGLDAERDVRRRGSSSADAFSVGSGEWPGRGESVSIAIEAWPFARVDSSAVCGRLEGSIIDGERGGP